MQPDPQAAKLISDLLKRAQRHYTPAGSDVMLSILVSPAEISMLQKLAKALEESNSKE